MQSILCSKQRLSTVLLAAWCLFGISQLAQAQEEHVSTAERPIRSRSTARSFVITDTDGIEKTLDSLNLDPKVKERIMRSFTQGIRSNGGARVRTYTWNSSDDQDSASIAEANAKAKERLAKRRKEQQEKMASASKEAQQRLQEAMTAMQEAQKEVQRDATNDEEALKSARKKLSDVQKKLQEAQKELAKARSGSGSTLNNFNINIPNMRFQGGSDGFSIFGNGEGQHFDLDELQGMTEQLGKLRMNMPNVNILRNRGNDDDTEIIINGEVIKPRNGVWHIPHMNKSFRFRTNIDEDDDNDDNEERTVIIKKNKKTINGKTEMNVEVFTDDNDDTKAPKAPSPKALKPEKPAKPKTPKQSEKSSIQE